MAKGTMMLCAIIGVLQSGFSYAAKEEIVPGNFTDSISYILGRDVGDQLRRLGRDFSLEFFFTGVEEAIAGERSSIDRETSEILKQRFALDVQERLDEQQERINRTSRRRAKSFMNQNRRRKGVSRTTSGLQYVVQRRGKGENAGKTDTVEVIFTLMLQDSTIVDRTLPDMPATLFLERSIPGIQEGIGLMNPGSIYRFYIPPEIAYGEYGVPPGIPPYSVLIFHVELVGIKNKK